VRGSRLLSTESLYPLDKSFGTGHHYATMKGRKRGTTEEQGHRFGGSWTETKLEILRSYLESYSTALQKQRFTTAYIDAFAGTGYRASEQADAEGQPLFPDLAEAAPQEFLEGSARIALRVKPRFDRYVFIEKEADRCRQLEALRNEFPQLSEDIQIRQGDANAVIQTLCKKSWKSHRAVLFLDPYGMQVEWATIGQIARTGAIDLWLLFPLGIGVNRLLPRSGQIPEGWRARLDRFLGTDDWYESFYRSETTTNLFGEEETTIVKARVEEIGEYFVDRLKSVFPGVAPKPKVLVNSTNCPLYLFCFAVGSANPNARAIALRIARHILESD
jgi:three-Cys-motif partner protein